MYMFVCSTYNRHVYIYIAQMVYQVLLVAPCISTPPSPPPPPPLSLQTAGGSVAAALLTEDDIQQEVSEANDRAQHDLQGTCIERCNHVVVQYIMYNYIYACGRTLKT